MKYKVAITFSIIVGLLAPFQSAFASTANDTFTATVGTFLENHISDSGNSWTKGFGTGSASITTANRVVGSSGSGVVYNSSWSPTSENYSVTADLYIASNSFNNVGVIGRASTSTFTGYIAVVYNATTLRLYRANGSGTSIGTAAVSSISVGSTHTIKLSMEGTVIKVYWDGSEVISATDNHVTSPGTAGLYLQGSFSDSTGIHIDNFTSSEAASALSGGTLSKTSQTSSSVTLSWTSGSGGVSPITSQLQRSASGAGSWSNVSGATTSPVTDTGLTTSTAYDYRVAFTDASSTVAYSNTVTATTSANLSLGTYGTVVTAEGTLLHYWPMTDSSGSNTIASAIGGTAINLTGATSGVSGQVDGTAVSFNGTSNYGVTASTLELSSYNKVVVEALLNYNFNSGGSVAWESSANLNNISTGFAFLPTEPSSTGNSNVILKGNSGYNYGFYTRPSTSAWHHVVAVYDKSATTNEVELYVDGVLQTAGSRPSTSNNTNNFGNNLFYLMSRGGSSLFTDGSIQHLAIYSDLSASRILAHYQTAFATSTITAGTLSEVSHGTSTATLSWTAASGGVSPVTAQLQRSASGAASWSSISGATTSPFTDTGLATSTSYDYRVAFTDASSTVAYSNTTTITTDSGTATSTTYTVQLDDLWDNNYDNISAPRQSPFARFVFTTNAASITVTGNTTLYGSFPAWAHLGVRVNGTALSPLAFSANGNQNFTVSLGTAGTSRTVEIITGLQSTAGGANSLGSFITSVTYPNTASFNVQTPVATNRVLFYGDSISVGGNSANPEYQAYVPLLRTTYGFNTMLEGWGYRALYDDASNSTKQNNFISHMASSNPSTIWFAIGTNDYGLNKWNASSFGTAYAAVLDGLHAALPSTHIYCQTPLLRTTETANGSGSTLGDYRTQITNICNARTSFATVVDGAAFLSSQDLADGLHPTTAGFVKYANRIAPILSQPSYTVSGPSSGIVSQSSTAFTVALTGTSTFMGDQSITISDGGQGGTFTPSVGSATTTGIDTITPTNGSTSFTFTYNPASVGAKTLTFSNGQAWNDPVDVTYTATPLDSTSPTISSISTNPVSSSEVSIAWTTDEVATSQVEYGLSATYTDSSTLNTNLTTSHSVALSGLTANTTYHYRVISTDASGNTATSSDQTFVTQAESSSGGSSGGGSSRRSSSSGGSSVIVSTTPVQVPAQEAGPVITPTTFVRNLALQARGEDVRTLQQFLIAKGFLATGNDTGYFGPLTYQALVQYQSAMGIYPTSGYFGPTTRSVIAATANMSTTTVPTNSASTVQTFTKDLKLGVSDAEVRFLQQYLNSNGFSVSVEGAGSAGQETTYFGPATQAALVRFQQSKGITPAVGYFGPITRQYIATH